MKRHILAATAIVVTIFVVTIAVFRAKTVRLSLDAEYYGISDIQSIDSDVLNQLIQDKKSFGLFISQPSCQASEDFEQYLADFTETYNLKFYKINFSNLKDSNIIPELRFYPSFAIFYEGEVVDFLAADSDEDAAAYTSVDGFKDWFTKYVKLEV